MHAAALFAVLMSTAVVDTEHAPFEVVPPPYDDATEISNTNDRSETDAVAETGRAPTEHVSVVVPVHVKPRGDAVTLSGTRNVNVALGAASGPARLASTKVIVLVPPGAIDPGPDTESMLISEHGWILPENA